MKAYVCHHHGSPSQLVEEEITSTPPGENEVQVKVEAFALNFPDLLIISGDYQYRPPLPFIPCAEGAGVVTAVGSGATAFSPGDRVRIHGLNGCGVASQQVTLPEQNLSLLPRSLSSEEGAAFGVTYTTSLYGLKQKGQLQAGETLVVLGSGGGVGLAAVAIGKAMGARVIAAASTEEKLAVAKSYGADACINYRQENLKEAIKALTDGQGADVILDPVGSDYTEQALRATAPNGRLLIVGFAAGSIPSLKANLMLLKDCSVIGVNISRFSRQHRQEYEENFKQLCQWFDDGSLTPPEICSYPWHRFIDACEDLGKGAALGKLVIKTDG